MCLSENRHSSGLHADASGSHLPVRSAGTCSLCPGLRPGVDGPVLIDGAVLSSCRLPKDRVSDRELRMLSSVESLQRLSEVCGFVVVCCNDAVRLYAFRSQVQKTSFCLIPLGLQNHGTLCF